MDKLDKFLLTTKKIKRILVRIIGLKGFAEGFFRKVFKDERHD